MSNDQGLGGSAIYVWDAGGPPSPDALGRFQTDQRSANAAIPMYEVTGAPVAAADYPDDQGLVAQAPPQGAVPIKIVSRPTANADGTYPSDPSNPNGAIPVWFVGAAPMPGAPYPNQQSAAGGAIPVYVVA